jgi:hypothetical protein
MKINVVRVARQCRRTKIIVGDIKKVILLCIMIPTIASISTFDTPAPTRRAEVAVVVVK